MSGADEALRGQKQVPTREGPRPSAGMHFFPTPADLRAWYEENHDRFDELWVGLYKKGTGLPTVTVAEAIDEALCFGWIDGLKRSVDEKSYKLRFTPRRKRSSWSARNLARMEHLIEAGLVADAGLAAYRAGAPRRETPRACLLPQP